MAVAKANIGTEKVGSTIMSPFQEVKLLMLALEGGEGGAFGSVAVADDCAGCPASARSCSWANVCFCKRFRGCCAARDLSRPKTGAVVFVRSFLCSPAQYELHVDCVLFWFSSFVGWYQDVQHL